MIDIFKFKIFLKQNINYFQIKKKKKTFFNYLFKFKGTVKT